MNRYQKMLITPIKRNQLVINSGVGAIVRTRNGVTALVCALKDWDASVPVGKDLFGVDRDLERNRFLKKLELHDPELELACNVPRFIAPYPVSDEPSRFTDWFIPVVRFPLAGHCTNWQCQRIVWSESDDPKNAKCSHCAQQVGKRLRKRPVQQMPIFKVCASGHVDEIDCQVETHAACGHGCSSLALKVTLGNSVKKPLVTCVDCGCKSDPQGYEGLCTGTSPWALGLAATQCGEMMHVVERTSVQAYYSQVKSALYMPAPNNFNDLLLDWLPSFDGFDFVDVNNAPNVDRLFQIVSDLNFGVTRDQLIEHIAYLKSEKDSSIQQTWNELAARTRELDVLTSPASENTTTSVRLLEHEVLDISSLNSALFGRDGLFTGVTAIYKLTETRVQDGFSRFRPPLGLSTLEGQRRLWGLGDAVGQWLPGYRVYGEGILFVLNRSAVAEWELKFQDDRRPDNARFKLAHSLAHLILCQAALDCGYQVAGIRDRIYDLPDGRLAFMVYTADGDSVGTLGGLVELASKEKLNSLVEKAIASGAWCAQDPVCIGTQSFQTEHKSGACHQCVILPETSCETFNRNLDRGMVYGQSERLVPKFV